MNYTGKLHPFKLELENTFFLNCFMRFVKNKEKCMLSDKFYNLTELSVVGGGVVRRSLIQTRRGEGEEEVKKWLKTPQVMYGCPLCWRGGG